MPLPRIPARVKASVELVTCHLSSVFSRTAIASGGNVFLHSEVKNRQRMLTSRRLLNRPRSCASSDEALACSGKAGVESNSDFSKTFEVREKDDVRRAIISGE